MFGTRQGPARRSGRSILALSTLALLAFCCLPALASASSAGYQYEDAPQTATGKPPSESNLSGGSSSTSGIGSGAEDSKAQESGSAGANGGRTGNPSSKTDRSGTGNSTGEQRGKGENAADEASGVPISGSAPGTDDGGSPLVPILILIAVLAAGSIAYLVAKRRRAGEAGPADSPASPKAS